MKVEFLTFVKLLTILHCSGYGLRAIVEARLITTGYEYSLNARYARSGKTSGKKWEFPYPYPYKVPETSILYPNPRRDPRVRVRVRVNRGLGTRAWLCLLVSKAGP